MANELKEKTDALVNLLVGKDEDGDDGPLVKAVKAEISPQIEKRLDEIGDNIEGLKSKVSEGPPSADRKKYPDAPWSSAAQILGVSDANWFNPDAIGKQLDGKFSDFKEYLRAVIKSDMSKGRFRDERLIDIGSVKSFKGALTGEEIELGGALVPEEFRPQLLMMMLQGSSIRRMATVIPIEVPQVTIPAIRDADHSNLTTFGGVSFAWLEVNEEIDESEPDFKLVELNARSLAGRTVLPNTLISDSFTSVPALIMRLFQMSVPWIEESVFLRGTGVGQPLGILNSPAAVNKTRDASNQFGVEDAYEMMSRLPPSSIGRASWIMHPTVLPELGTLNNDQVQAWQPALTNDIPDRLLGKPVIWNEHASGLGTRGDVMLCDWMYYLIGDLQALSMAASPHEKFSSNRTVLRAIERLDGTPWLDTPIRPAQRPSGSDYTMSPFVILN